MQSDEIFTMLKIASAMDGMRSGSQVVVRRNIAALDRNNPPLAVASKDRVLQRPLHHAHAAAALAMVVDRAVLSRPPR